jgi:hypothetical protein
MKHHIFRREKNKFIHINREFEDKLRKNINQRVMEICYKKIFCRIVKKVVQCRRQRIEQELALCQALDSAIKISHRAQLEAKEAVGNAEDAVIFLLVDLGKETPNEEIDEVVADESEEEGEEKKKETTNDIAQRITLKINELKKIFQNNKPILNHKHSDLTKTKIQDCLKVIKNDYEKPLKRIDCEQRKVLRRLCHCAPEFH